MRDLAIKNSPGGKLPSRILDIPHPLPPPSPPPEEADVMDLSMELSNVTLDEPPSSDLDESGMDRVPIGDPGIDVNSQATILNLFTYKSHLAPPVPNGEYRNGSSKWTACTEKECASWSALDPECFTSRGLI